MVTKAFPYSQFLRAPSQVLPALGDGDVVLQRRGQADLVLAIEGRYRAGQEAVLLTARLFHDLVRRDGGLAEALLSEQLPWLRWLPEIQRKECLVELLDDLAAGADIHNLTRFMSDLQAWRSTAEVWSDPELAHRLRGPFEGDGPALERPATVN